MFQSAFIAVVCLTVHRTSNRYARNVSIRFHRGDLPHSAQIKGYEAFVKVSIRFQRGGLPHIEREAFAVSTLRFNPLSRWSASRQQFFQPFCAGQSFNPLSTRWSASPDTRSDQVLANSFNPLSTRWSASHTTRSSSVYRKRMVQSAFNAVV